MIGGGRYLREPRPAGWNFFRDFIFDDSELPIAGLPASFTSPQNPGRQLEDAKGWRIGDNYYLTFIADPGGIWGLYVATTTVTAFPAGWSLVSETPLIQAGSQPGLNDFFVAGCKLVFDTDADEIRLYYHAQGDLGGGVRTKDQMCMATTATKPSDGVFPTSFTPYAQNPVFAPPGDTIWCNDGIVLPPCETGNGLWRMITSWDDDGDALVWRAYNGTSPDGIAWTVDPEECIPLGAAGEWDSGGVLPVGQAIKSGSVWYVPYQGYGGGNTPPTAWQTGWASTTDFVTFTKCPANPVIKPRSGMCSAENPAFFLHTDGHVYAVAVCSRRAAWANYADPVTGGNEYYWLFLARPSAFKLP